MKMYGDKICVSRSALVQFAWSAPMRDLAAKLDISDVGLKKILKSHGIVTPPQGHWNRVHAGQAVDWPPASAPRHPGETGLVALDSRFTEYLPTSKNIPVGGPFQSEAVPEDLEELRAMEVAAIGKIGRPRDLSREHPGLALFLKREQMKREKAQASAWSSYDDAFGTALAQRQLKLINELFFALAKRGHSGSAFERDRELDGHFLIGDERLGFSFACVGKHRTERVYGNLRPARDLPASTPLRLTLRRTFTDGVPASWEDDDTGRLETRLAGIAADIIVAGEASFRQGLVEAEERAAQWRQWEEERRLKRISELENRRIEDLRLSGKLLAEANEIRMLTEQMRDALLAGETGVSPEEVARWEKWATDYADRIDPVKSGQFMSHFSVPELDGPNLPDDPP